MENAEAFVIAGCGTALCSICELRRAITLLESGQINDAFFEAWVQAVGYSMEVDGGDIHLIRHPNLMA